MTIAVLAVLAIVGTESLVACPTRIEGQRLKKPAFKGVELYSWKHETGPFRFSLLWGTNRNKSDSEIKAQRCVLFDVPAVKAVLGHLAEGEHVFWANATCPQKDCEYPPGEVMQELRSHAQGVGVALEVPPSGQTR